MSESVLIVVAIIVVAIIVAAITVLGLAICVLAGYLARILDCKVTIGEVGRAIGAIVGVGLEAVATIITSVRRPWEAPPHGGAADFLGLDCGETVGGGRQGRYRRCAVDLRSSLDNRPPPRKRANTRKSAGNAGQTPGSELLGLGHPGTVQELVERRIHDVGDRVPAVLQHLHALLRARTHIGVQRHLLLPLTQGQPATGSFGRTAVESILSRIGHARILHASLKVVCMHFACMYARTLLQ